MQLTEGELTLFNIPERTLRSGKYKALFFDAGNTLFKVRPSVGVVYARTAEKFGFISNPKIEAQVEIYFRAEWKRRSVNGQFDLGGTQREERQWWYDLVKAVFDRLGGIVQFDMFFDHLYKLFATPAVWQLFPEAIDVLKICRERGMILGIVSNWDSRLLKICEELELTTRFDFIIASAMVGVSKPNPGIFKIALERAGVRPDEVLHIGDSMLDDIHGARSVGIDALLVDRSHDCTDKAIPVADSLRAVVEFV